MFFAASVLSRHQVWILQGRAGHSPCVASAWLALHEATELGQTEWALSQHASILSYATQLQGCFGGSATMPHAFSR